MRHESTSTTMKSTSSAPLRPISIEIATDSSVSYLAQTADLYLLAADRIYPNGDVSNKIGCLSAALSMRYYGGRHDGLGGQKKTVVISTTDKISARSERCSSFEENNGWEVSAAWADKAGAFDDDDDKIKRKERIEDGDDIMGEMRVRNVYFETVPKDLIDVYLTEKGTVDLVEIKEKSKEHWLREVAAFEDIL